MMETTLAFAVQLLSALPGLMAAGVEVTEMIERFTGKVADMKENGREPTEEEWKELNDEIARLRGDLHSDT
jgi:hypothetical protein